LLHIPPPLTSTLFPYTTLFRSTEAQRDEEQGDGKVGQRLMATALSQLTKTGKHGGENSRTHSPQACWHNVARGCHEACWLKRMADRKSTRLNSSHVAISYAVFC